MAKKSRRVRRKGERPRLSETQLVQPTQVVQEAPLAVEEVVVPSVDQPKEADFRQEYHYVVRDLQRIGLLAAAMLVGLLILSLFL